MANKRQFKKSLEALSSALVSEMMAALYNEKVADSDKINEAISKIAGAMLKAKNDTSLLFGKSMKEFENLKAYNKAKSEFTKEQYQKAVADYNESLEAALKAYNEGMPKNAPSEKQ